MNPAHFDLNDIEHEPSDEQLAALMQLVAEEACRRAARVQEDLLADLRAGLDAAKSPGSPHV
jgi:hypothetical protein